jgi:GAF domain-containing protein
MIPDKNTSYERDRLKNLMSYDILDTDTEESFDDLTKLASAICGTPMALITLIDSDRQWFKSKVGLDGSETPRDVSFCTHAIGQHELFQIPDATKDQRFKNNPFVTGKPHIRFYAGAPLTSKEGFDLGTLCVVDEKPRVLSELQAEALRILAHQAVELIQIRKINKDLNLARNMLVKQQDLMLVRARSESARELARDVFHEINEPLAFISHRTNILRNQLKKLLPGNEYVLRELDLIENTAVSVSGVLKTLHLYSKNKNENLIAIDLNEMIENVLTLYGNRIRDGKILLSFDKGSFSKVWCEPDLVNQAITELIENALHNLETADVKVLKIKTDLLDNRFTLLVSDTGVGENKALHFDKCHSLIKECGGEFKVIRPKNPTSIQLTLSGPPF